MQNPADRPQARRQGRVARVVLGALCVATVGFSAACASKTQAAAQPEGPPLAVPAPPPRVLAPVEELAVAPQPEAAPETAAVEPPAAKPAPPRAETPPPAAAQPAAPEPAAAPEPREVRAVPAAAAAGEERKVRDVMARAANDLNRVNYQRLSAAGKEQYDQSKRFSEQADQALRERNYVYAMTLADKAATLAAELAGRR